MEVSTSCMIGYAQNYSASFPFDSKRHNQNNWRRTARKNCWFVFEKVLINWFLRIISFFLYKNCWKCIHVLKLSLSTLNITMRYRLETLKLGVNKKYFLCISHKENTNGFSLFVPSHIFTWNTFFISHAWSFLHT